LLPDTEIDFVLLEKGGVKGFKVLAFTWHTIVMLSESAISYEKIMSRYEPKTWQKFA